MTTRDPLATRRLVGKLLISGVAVLWPVGALTADWNETHVFNPNWSPHAKFHNGQTIVLGVELAALSLWQLWGPARASRSSLRWGTLLAGLYFATQAPAVLLPGAELVDPEFADRLPVLGGIRINQITLSLLGSMPALALGYKLAAGAVTNQRTDHRDGLRAP